MMGWPWTVYAASRSPQKKINGCSLGIDHNKSK